MPTHAEEEAVAFASGPIRIDTTNRGGPLIAWANVGHGGFFQTFPIGAAAALAADSHTLHLLDPPLIPAGAPGPP